MRYADGREHLPAFSLEIVTDVPSIFRPHAPEGTIEGEISGC